MKAIKTFLMVTAVGCLFVQAPAVADDTGGEAVQRKGAEMKAMRERHKGDGG